MAVEKNINLKGCDRTVWIAKRANCSPQMVDMIHKGIRKGKGEVGQRVLAATKEWENFTLNYLNTLNNQLSQPLIDPTNGKSVQIHQTA